LRAQQLAGKMFIGTTQQFAAGAKETPGKERDDADEEEEADDDDGGDDDVTGDITDDVSQPRTADAATAELPLRWTPVSYSSLPDWLRDNELIETGHRPQLGNFYACLESVVRLHSETGNVWTHLLGQQHQPCSRAYSKEFFSGCTISKVHV